MPVTHLTITDRLGVGHAARYVYRDRPDEDRGDLSPAMLEQFIDMARSALPYPSEDLYETLRQKFRNDDSFITVLSAAGEPEAFQIFRRCLLPFNGHQLRVLHVNQAATLPAVWNRGIASILRCLVLDFEQPDIICGSSPNPTIYSLNRRIANERGLLIFPNEAPPPATVSQLGHRIHDAFQLAHVTDDRLVRTYPVPARKHAKPHPLKEALNLQENQHLLYMLVSPALLDQLSREGREP